MAIVVVHFQLRIIPASAGQTDGHRRCTLSTADHPRECGANVESPSNQRIPRGSSPRVRGKLPVDQHGHHRRRIIPASAGQTPSSWLRPPCRSDHPRECGANHLPYQVFFFAYGSSPRVRGKLRSSDEGDGRTRIIPASAGQTANSARTWAGDADHPRECGANVPKRAQNPVGLGSSPRVRGKHFQTAGAKRACRIIPASAGQTSVSNSAGGWRPDHPRECGANQKQGEDAKKSLGSSPRVRGKLFFDGGHAGGERIIPASAGQTAAMSAGLAPNADHPRECGANQVARLNSDGISGSSPRVRGKPLGRRASARPSRIIPASAGQTETSRLTLKAPTDHPRECGANHSWMYARRRQFGSSPRVRGKLIGLLSRIFGNRIIPASAGQTSSSVGGATTTTDHPRECGANLTQSCSIERVIGSSPRVRGKRTGEPNNSVSVRIIPASAGQTWRPAYGSGARADHPRECGANGSHSQRSS